LRRLLIPILTLTFVLPAAPSDTASPIPPFWGVGGAADNDNQGEQVLAKYMSVSGRGMARGFSSVARFFGKLPKMNKAANLAARRHIDTRGSVEYTDVIVRAGDSTVQKDVIARFMSGEVESTTLDPAKDKDRLAVAITPDNYIVQVTKALRRFAGKSSRLRVVNPKKKRVGLFKGRTLDRRRNRSHRERGWPFRQNARLSPQSLDFERQYAITRRRIRAQVALSQIQTASGVWLSSKSHVHRASLGSGILLAVIIV